jgi:hypothetical protein
MIGSDVQVIIIILTNGLQDHVRNRVHSLADH